jgi:hypothetical protein
MQYRHDIRLYTLVLIAATIFGCTTTNVKVSDQFPVPLMPKTQVNLGIHLDDALKKFVYREKIANTGEWIIGVGAAQENMFVNLATGVFESYSLVSGPDQAAGMDGVLQPSIAEVQFSIPKQTRSKYYEVWLKYQFKLFDRQGNLVGEWSLPAYGKAHKQDYGSSGSALEAAALAACRDAMAFFSFNFEREPSIRQWLRSGKPIVPPTPAASPTTTPAANQTGPTTGIGIAHSDSNKAGV